MVVVAGAVMMKSVIFRHRHRQCHVIVTVIITVYVIVTVIIIISSLAQQDCKPSHQQIYRFRNRFVRQQIVASSCQMLQGLHPS